MVLRLVLVSYAKSSSTRGERKPRGFMVPSCKRQASSRARPELREDAEFSNRGALEGLPLLGLGSLVTTLSTRLLLRGSFGILGARSRHLEVVVSSSYPKSVAVLSPLPCGTGPSRALPSTGGGSECPAATGGHRGGFRFSRKRDVSGVCSTCLVAPSYQIKGVTI